MTFFQNLAQTNSPHRNGFLGAYLFGAGVYVFFGTLFELFGLQAVTTAGGSISLPAPLSDINAAISVGCMSYLVAAASRQTSSAALPTRSRISRFPSP